MDEMLPKMEFTASGRPEALAAELFEWTRLSNCLRSPTQLQEAECAHAQDASAAIREYLSMRQFASRHADLDLSRLLPEREAHVYGLMASAMLNQAVLAYYRQDRRAQDKALEATIFFHRLYKTTQPAARW